MRVTCSAALISTGLALMACGGDSPTDPGETDPVPVATVELSLTADTLSAGRSIQLSATAKEASGNTLPGRSASWTTDNASIAQVNSTGLVTGVNKGSTVIHASIEGVSTSAHITVVVGVTGSWMGSVMAAGTTCPLILALTETLDGVITGGGLVEEPCNAASFASSGMHGVGGRADSVHLVLSFEDEGDVVLDGTFDGVGAMSGLLLQTPCTGTECPWTLERTSIVTSTTSIPVVTANREAR